MGGGDVRKRKGGGTKSEPEPNKTTASSVPEQKKSEVTAPTSPVNLQCVLILCTLSILAILVSMGVLGALLVSFEGQFSAGFTTSSSHHHEGPRSRARAPREHRTQDLQVHVQTSLEDVYFGHTVHFPRLRTIVCSTCDGSGMREGAEVITCPHCRGQGFEVFKQRMGHITFDQRVQCSHCGGAGASVNAADRCPHCRGAGAKQETQQLELQVPMGIHEGGHVVLEGKANEHPEANPGDLYVQVSTSPHKIFTRRDQIHLDTTLEITLLEALNGFQRKIRHLSGEIMTIRRSDISHHGQIISFPGRGMPAYQGNGEKGDLFVNIRVKLPAFLTTSQSETVRTLLADVEFSNEDRL